MTKTISQLWNGDLAPIQYFREHNPEIKHLEQLSQRNLDKLVSALDEPLQKLLDPYNNCISKYMVVVSEQAFCDGFSLGLKLLSEALFDQAAPA